VNTWLPWLTHSMIEPIVRLQEAYGVVDTPVVTGQRLLRLRMKDKAYAQSRGRFSSGHQHRSATSCDKGTPASRKEMIND
jgi:hypothetical protein